MIYSSRLRTYTGSVLLESSANQSLVTTCFEWLTKLPLDLTRIRRIKVADKHMLTVHHKTLSFTITTGTLTSNLWLPVTDFKFYNIILGIN